MLWINRLTCSRISGPDNAITFAIEVLPVRPHYRPAAPPSTWTIIIHSHYLLLIAVCNRTYYGDIGRTYSLRVPPPQWTRLPFLCHLTFTASGHEQGDLVQVSCLRLISNMQDILHLDDLNPQTKPHSNCKQNGLHFNGKSNEHCVHFKVCLRFA